MGESLVPILKDVSHSGKEAALSVTVSRTQERNAEGGRIKGYSIRTPRHRYTVWDEGKAGEELYDYQTDPEELTNLVTDSGHRDLLESMKKILASQIARATKG
jgi:hypothetical protein